MDCDDEDPCTDDTCDALIGCRHEEPLLPPLPGCVSDCAEEPSGTPCVDGDPCAPDMCVLGECMSMPSECDDGDPCTDELCDAEKGCASVPIPGCELVCGNSLVQQSEQCDDGNTNDGDGCSSSCLIEVGPALDEAIVQAIAATEQVIVEHQEEPAGVCAGLLEGAIDKWSRSRGWLTGDPDHRAVKGAISAVKSGLGRLRSARRRCHKIAFAVAVARIEDSLALAVRDIAQATAEQVACDGNSRCEESLARVQQQIAKGDAKLAHGKSTIAVSRYRSAYSRATRFLD